MKNKNKKRMILGIASAALIAAGGFGIWFLIYSWQPKLKPSGINTPEAAVNVLIAAQGRSHKTKTLDIIAEYYAGKDVYISVVDVSSLPDINSSEWDYIVLFSAIQMYKLNPDVEAFLKRTAENKRIFLFNTSGGTQMGYGSVNAITSASANPQDSAQTIIGVIDKAIEANKSDFSNSEIGF
ncbi:MAG: hypothetical protein LBC67_01690 [Spirochaetales bacterium]|jgi:hypothetical protein|nr:hypothetical protein [Spirochaetales bacterium]